MRNKKIHFLFALAFYSIISTAKDGYFSNDQAILQIPLGAASDLAQKTLGKPSLNTEKFASVAYDVWEYKRPNGKPLGFLTIDPKTKKIAGRSVWIYEQDQEYATDRLLKEYFKPNRFETLIPCQSRGNEEVLVDKANGIFVATRDRKTTLVSWSDPGLTQLRIQQFYTKCSKLQKKPGVD